MQRIKRFLFIMLFIIFIFPMFVNAGTELGTSTQHPIVGSTIYIQMDLLYPDTYNIRDLHVIVKYDPNYFSFEKVSWIQSSGSYSDDQNGTIYIDKEAGTDWHTGAALQLKFTVKKSGLSQIEVKRNGDSHYSDGNVIGQSFAGVYIDAKEPSTSVLLKGLYIEGHEIAPTFSRTNTEYSLSVPPSVNRVEVIAQKGDPNQTITGAGYRELSYGENKIHVVVQAQDGTTNTYNINVKRTDNRTGDTTLKSLTIGDQIIPIEEGKYTYETTVTRSTDNILLSARTTDPNATLIGTGRKSLNIGSNQFVLNIESSNGKKGEYAIIINRSTEEFNKVEESNKLRNIKVNGQNLDLADQKTRWFYGIISDLDSVEINAVAESETAKITITGNENLQPGINLVEIKVTEMKNITEERPETPADSTIYQLVVYKNPSNTLPINSFEELTSDTDLFYYSTDETKSTLTSDILKTISSNKLYYNIVNMYNGILYQVVIPGNKFTDDIDVSFKETSSQHYETSLPEGMEILLNVGDKYLDNTNVKIYTYNEQNEYKLLTDGITVQNGYIKFNTNGDTNYIITTASLIKEDGPIVKWFKKNKNIILTILGVLLAIIVILAIIFNKKKKISSNEPQY